MRCRKEKVTVRCLRKGVNLASSLLITIGIRCERQNNGMREIVDQEQSVVRVMYERKFRCSTVSSAVRGDSLGPPPDQMVLHTARKVKLLLCAIQSTVSVVLLNKWCTSGHENDVPLRRYFDKDSHSHPHYCLQHTLCTLCILTFLLN